MKNYNILNIILFFRVLHLKCCLFFNSLPMLCQCNIFPLCFCLSYLFGNTGLLRLSTRCQVASSVLVRVYAIAKNWRGGEDPRCILAPPIKRNLKRILNNMKGTLKSDFEMLKKKHEK